MRSRDYKDWSELNDTQKRHRIFRVVSMSALYFWRICGRDRQQYYSYTGKKNPEELRYELFYEYVKALELYPDHYKRDKIARMAKELGLSDLLHNLENKH